MILYLHVSLASRWDSCRHFSCRCTSSNVDRSVLFIGMFLYLLMPSRATCWAELKNKQTKKPLSYQRLLRENQACLVRWRFKSAWIHDGWQKHCEEKRCWQFGWCKPCSSCVAAFLLKSLSTMPRLLDNFPSVKFSFYIELSQHAVWKGILGRAGGCHSSLSLTCGFLVG